MNLASNKSLIKYLLFTVQIVLNVHVYWILLFIKYLSVTVHIKLNVHVYWILLFIKCLSFTDQIVLYEHVYWILLWIKYISFTVHIVLFSDWNRCALPEQFNTSLGNMGHQVKDFDGNRCCQVYVVLSSCHRYTSIIHNLFSKRDSNEKE